MSDEIGINHINEYKKQILIKATGVPSSLKAWSRCHVDGRIIVGYKRIAIGYPLYRALHFKPLSIIAIIRNKINW